MLPNEINDFDLVIDSKNEMRPTQREINEHRIKLHQIS